MRSLKSILDRKQERRKTLEQHLPRIVEQLIEDLNTVHDLLVERQTGEYTRNLEKEIETTLEELIEALQQDQEEQEQQQQQQQQKQQQQQQQQQPLVPTAAELKLLKAAQLRVNRRTKAFQVARPKKGINEPLKKELGKITKRQGEVAGIAEEMAVGP